MCNSVKKITVYAFALVNLIAGLFASYLFAHNTFRPVPGADWFTVNENTDSNFSSPVSGCSGTSDTWLGTTSADWNAGSNWCSGFVPSSSTAVLIPAGTPNNPVISNADAWAASIAISSGASLTMTGTYNLTLSNSGSL